MKARLGVLCDCLQTNKMASGSSVSDITSILLKDIDAELDIYLEHTSNEQKWGKDLTYLPLFTIKEIEKHRENSGKRGKAIMKTMDRGRRFHEERYISTDSIFTMTSANEFTVKATCKASMKKDHRKMKISLNKHTGEVNKGDCDCPAGKSGYCNHVMALLFELANYSLQQLKSVPEEVACTSRSRQWGIPPEAAKNPEPVMNTAIKKICKSKGVTCTLYNPRINADQDNLMGRIINMNNNLKEKDKRIGFAHVIDYSLPKVNTIYGDSMVGSPLSYQLAVFESNFKVISNITNDDHEYCTDTNIDVSDIKLPTNKINVDDELFPKDWEKLTYSEKCFFDQISLKTLEMCQELEQITVGQANNKRWLDERKFRITSSNAHKVFI